MYLERLYLKNFRNIINLSLDFTTPITIFYGENGQGKTNIVESIFTLANTNSFRTSYFKEMIFNQQDEAVIEGKVNFKNKKEEYKMVLKKNGKIALIDQVLVTKFSEYIGRVNAICFSPEDVSLFKDSPSDRRHFLNKELSALFPIYIKQLICFKEVLNQRNNLLKNKIDENLLEVITDKLIESSYDIFKRRQWLILKLADFATSIYQTITNQSQKIEIKYNTYLNELNQEEYFIKARAIYKNNLNKDIEKMYTNIGVHKDDFQVYLNEMPIDMYASQGQQRLISLCLKLAVADIVFKATKEEPILILDDAFSELDQDKKRKVFNCIKKYQQVFITCTDYKNIIDINNQSNITTIHIKNGNIVERSSI